MLGPSGSGKTTTLRLIAGFERPDEGRVELARPRRHRAAAVRARREHRLPGLRALPAHDRGRERRLRAADQARRGASARARRRGARDGQLDGYGGAGPAQLSGGQRQRVALARAIVNRPQVLLLDEPLGALDLKLRQEMQIELKRIQREVGITFVYVTHDQDEALTMSDRLAVFNLGRSSRSARRPRSTSIPRTEFVAGFVGVSNVLERDGSADQRPPGEDPDPRRGRQAEPGAHVEGGHDREVVYAGMATRYLVELDGGGELTVVRQNLETSSAQALEARGRASGWPGGPSTHSHSTEGEEEHE